MANASTTQVHQDVGIAWNHLVGTTTTIVKGLITRAQNDIKNITGTTSGAVQDAAIRNLADYYVMLNAMNTLDPNKANDLFLDVANGFRDSANNSLRLKGKTLDGIKIQFTQVNP